MAWAKSDGETSALADAQRRSRRSWRVSRRRLRQVPRPRRPIWRAKSRPRPIVPPAQIAEAKLDADYSVALFTTPSSRRSRRRSRSGDVSLFRPAESRRSAEVVGESKEHWHRLRPYLAHPDVIHAIFDGGRLQLSQRAFDPFLRLRHGPGRDFPGQGGGVPEARAPDCAEPRGRRGPLHDRHQGGRSGGQGSRPRNERKPGISAGARRRQGGSGRAEVASVFL